MIQNEAEKDQKGTEESKRTKQGQRGKKQGVERKL